MPHQQDPSITPSLYLNLVKMLIENIRGAMNVNPKRNNSPSKELISMCNDAATKAILLYQQMWSSGAINCERGYFQMLFTAGLSLIYCYSSKFRDAESAVTENDIGGTLQACTGILMELSLTLVDSQPYAYAFELVQNKFVAEQAKRGPIPTSTSCGNHSRVHTRQGSPVPGANSQLATNAETEDAIDASLPPMAGSDGFASQDWLLTEWDPLTSQLVSNMESDVSQYAVGDWM